MSGGVARSRRGQHEAVPVEIGHGRDPERHEAEEAEDGGGRERDHDDEHEEVAHAETVADGSPDPTGPTAWSMRRSARTRMITPMASGASISPNGIATRMSRMPRAAYAPLMLERPGWRGSRREWTWT
jgi:hypothetical protein